MVELYLKKLRNTLQKNSNESIKKIETRFYKEGEHIISYGIKTSKLNVFARNFKNEIKNLKKNEILRICESLWRSGIQEETRVACYIIETLGKNWDKSIFETYEKWVKKYVLNWAMCDRFMTKTIGNLIIKNKDLVEKTFKWTASKNRWVKRAAAVALINPIKDKYFLPYVFKVADALMTDNDDMVQKGYGWMLKVASKNFEEEVFSYVIKHKEKMPRTAFRYAIENMSKEKKDIAMDKKIKKAVFIS